MHQSLQDLQGEKDQEGTQTWETSTKKVQETIPCHTLCVDLIGPYKIGKDKKQKILHCLTMIDPATGWFEMTSISQKKADYVANYLEMTWLTRYPWLTEIVLDRGS